MESSFLNCVFNFYPLRNTENKSETLQDQNIMQMFIDSLYQKLHNDKNTIQISDTIENELEMPIAIKENTNFISYLEKFLQNLFSTCDSDVKVLIGHLLDNWN